VVDEVPDSKVLASEGSALLGTKNPDSRDSIWQTFIVEVDLERAMSIFRRGTNPFWAAFAMIYILGAIGMDFYWLFTESGAVRWLAILQGKILSNHWFPKVTFLVLLLAELGPLILLKVIIERLSGTRLTGPPEMLPPDPRPQ